MSEAKLIRFGHFNSEVADRTGTIIWTRPDGSHVEVTAVRCEGDPVEPYMGDEIGEVIECIGRGRKSSPLSVEGALNLFSTGSLWQPTDAMGEGGPLPDDKGTPRGEREPSEDVEIVGVTIPSLMDHLINHGAGESAAAAVCKALDWEMEVQTIAHGDARVRASTAEFHGDIKDGRLDMGLTSFAPLVFADDHVVTRDIEATARRPVVVHGLMTYDGRTGRALALVAFGVSADYREEARREKIREEIAAAVEGAADE